MIGLLALWMGTATGQEVPAAVATCAGCHGADGNSLSALWPQLAGQPALYLEKQLWDFKTGLRADPTMTAMAAALDGPTITTIATWYSAQRRQLPRDPQKPALVVAGGALFYDGDPSRGLAPCRACHGADGSGGQDARGNAFPAVSAQHADYLRKQLAAFATGERHNDPGGMMRLIASRLTAADIAAVAHYLGQLPPTSQPDLTAAVIP
jgi:cytochrome c553